MRLRDKVAVITGGAGGMGLATVERFLAEGAKVILADFNAATGEQALSSAHEAGHGARARFVRCDVAKEADVAGAVAAAVHEFGRLDIIFNNAGVGGAIGPIWEVEESEWDYTFDVLVKGVFFGIKHAVREFRRQGDGGVIINTASVAGLSGGCGPLVYSAAKSAVINLTRAAAVQLAPMEIRVNAICPGFILTGLTHPSQKTLEEAGQFLDGLQPWPHHGRGADIAGTAVFLASEDSAFITGEAMVVDGGLTALGPDYCQRYGSPREATMSKARVTRGTTGEAASVREIPR